MVLLSLWLLTHVSSSIVFFFQAEDGIRYLVRSRGLGDVYKRQVGCREGAKNTLLKNYLWFAERRGATLIPDCAVTDLSLIHI